MLYYSNYFIGQPMKKKNMKWFGFQGTLGELQKYLHSIWDSHTPNLFSHPIGISGVITQVAKSSQVDQMGVIRAEDGILKYFEGAKAGVDIGPVKRVPAPLIQQEAVS